MLPESSVGRYLSCITVYSVRSGHLGPASVSVCRSYSYTVKLGTYYPVRGRCDCPSKEPCLAKTQNPSNLAAAKQPTPPSNSGLQSGKAAYDVLSQPLPFCTQSSQFRPSSSLPVVAYLVESCTRQLVFAVAARTPRCCGSFCVNFFFFLSFPPLSLNSPRTAARRRHEDRRLKPAAKFPSPSLPSFWHDERMTLDHRVSSTCRPLPDPHTIPTADSAACKACRAYRAYRAHKMATAAVAHCPEPARQP